MIFIMQEKNKTIKMILFQNCAKNIKLKSDRTFFLIQNFWLNESFI